MKSRNYFGYFFYLISINTLCEWHMYNPLKIHKYASVIGTTIDSKKGLLVQYLVL